MSYDIYEVPMYHNGTFEKNEVGYITGFRSENTGQLYKIKRLEQESLMDVTMLYENDSDFRNHLYAEDMIITHEISGDVYLSGDNQGFCKAAWLDGKPLSQYDLTADFKLAIEDTVEQEHMNGSAFD